MLGLLFLLFAQAPLPDPPSPPADSAELSCQNVCHRAHCGQWVACNEIPDEKDQLACKQEANKAEERCRSGCDAS